MRYLKQKIAKSNQSHKSPRSSEASEASESLKKEHDSSENMSIKQEFEIQVKIEIPYEAFIKEGHIKKGKPKRSLGNNVMKNYAGAMIHFARSSIAEPYLAKTSAIQEMSIYTFREILRMKRKNTNCIKRFRKLLLIEDKDSQQARLFKCLFQEACKVFLKFFSVNWIYNSRLSEKSKYLKYRLKLLRRVQNPENFTYLEDFVPAKPENPKKSRGKLVNWINEKKEEF